MYKVVGEERFLLWAVCSIQLQVQPAFPNFALSTFNEEFSVMCLKQKTAKYDATFELYKLLLCVPSVFKILHGHPVILLEKGGYLLPKGVEIINERKNAKNATQRKGRNAEIIVSM